MLVLTRKVGQSIIINENIKVTVVLLDGGKVRLGIEAPPEVTVLREELRQRTLGYTLSAEELATVP